MDCRPKLQPIHRTLLLNYELVKVKSHYNIQQQQKIISNMLHFI